MVEPKVLRIYPVIKTFVIKTKILHAVVMQDKPTCLAPFAEAIDLITLWILEPTQLHASVVGYVNEAVVSICTVMRKYIGRFYIKILTLDPVGRAHRVKRKCNLIIQVGVVQYSPESVVKDINVCFFKFCGFLYPDPRQLTFRECDRLYLLALPCVVHPTKNNPPACCAATHR